MNNKGNKMKETRRLGLNAIKVIWMMGEHITKIAYLQSEKEATDAMKDIQNRKKGIAIKLYRSGVAGYVTIPED